ncbi:nuclear transport factor 2 family protein [Muribacter muris]|uniref:Nuclear transport factor 2 family protein n=1 Tax=Muribacter muris TaxID=67855 RepID=A0A4Y9JUX8_9PAST|nr:nuclear transport factor 2 family protein [Muribacter muris]MBF0785957.1 nuclear transport factor 2 family protein [Muribacter muris]MBF0826102.1 nuclear transport factor 2 family protein [Muribacter muris]TFV08246.1 nuclear transport factor 2 family protein [Muribacter muris]
MKLRHIFFSLLLSLTVSAVAVFPALYDMRNREAEQAALATLYAQLVAALETQDHQALEGLIADEFVLTLIHNRKRERVTKHEWLHNLKNGNVYYQMLTAVKVLPIGKDRLTATYQLSGSFFGENIQALRLKMYFRTKMVNGQRQITRMWINQDKAARQE